MSDLTEREKQIVAWLRERALQHRMNKECSRGQYFAEAYNYAAWVIERGEPFLGYSDLSVETAAACATPISD